jgi:hypothetical protein
MISTIASTDRVPSHRRSGRRTDAALRLAVAFGSVLALAACGGDGPTDPGPPETGGTVSFSFSGDQSGSFSAAGLIQGSPENPAFGTWAAAGWSQEDQQLAVAAFRARTAPAGDVFVLALGNTTGTGTVTLNGAPCLQGEEDGCAMGMLGFDVRQLGEFDPTNDRVYAVMSGTVTITMYTADRLRGTFSGTAVHLLDLFTSAPEPRTLTIANGSFDVPLIRE